MKPTWIFAFPRISTRGRTWKQARWVRAQADVIGFSAHLASELRGNRRRCRRSRQWDLGPTANDLEEPRSGAGHIMARVTRLPRLLCIARRDGGGAGRRRPLRHPRPVRPRPVRVPRGVEPARPPCLRVRGRRDQRRRHPGEARPHRGSTAPGRSERRHRLFRGRPGPGPPRRPLGASGPPLGGRPRRPPLDPRRGHPPPERAGLREPAAGGQGAQAHLRARRLTPEDPGGTNGGHGRARGPAPGARLLVADRPGIPPPAGWHPARPVAARGRDLRRRRLRRRQPRGPRASPAGAVGGGLPRGAGRPPARRRPLGRVHGWTAPRCAGPGRARRRPGRRRDLTARADRHPPVHRGGLALDREPSGRDRNPGPARAARFRRRPGRPLVARAVRDDDGARLRRPSRLRGLA